jgi:putative tryptophan/tyrosine transport system substrate-binding protein
MPHCGKSSLLINLLCSLTLALGQRMQFAQLKRREFIALLCGAAASPFAARAQQGERVRRVGMLINYAQTDREGQASVATFVTTLQRLGWIEDRNLRIDYRWTAGETERIKAAAAELVRSAPDAIAVANSPALGELRRLTSTIPLVFAQVGDPVDAGFVTNLARPGGNITGFSAFEPDMGGKWLGILKEAAPNLRRAAVLFGSDTPIDRAMLRAAQAVAPSLGITINGVNVLDNNIERTIADFSNQRDGGIIVLPHRYTLANRASIIIMAAGHRLPAVYPLGYFATEGGLLAYGPDQNDQWRGAATYVDRILRGEKPGDLPVQAPTKFELVINMKTAKALGLSIPPALPLRADSVIE